MGWLRNTSGTIAGVVAAQAVVFATEWLETSLYPPPADFDDYDAAQIAAYVAHAPLAAMLLLVGGWATGAFAGPWLALRITDWRASGWIVTALFLLGSLLNLLGLAHPVWMVACGVVLPLLGGWLAQAVHRKPYPGEALFG